MSPNERSAEFYRGAVFALNRAQRDFTVTVPELQAEYVDLLAAAEAREATAPELWPGVRESLDALGIRPRPIPDAELAELRRLYAAATQGRWRGDRYDETVKYWIVIEKSGNLEPVVQLSVRGDDFGASEQDCDWIMAAHNTFPGILARLEAAERERDELASVVKSPEYRQMLADLANLPARDAQQRREGAVEAFSEMQRQAEEVGQQSGLAKKMCKIFADECIEQAAKRLREGGE